ncbi:MAG: elongation factor G [Defluviitaleaceae bacterium]|nr:elongation factor G [Defluviitaleaceae bacterium]
MKVYTANEIRNIAVLGHSGCGKTTLMEAALNATKVTTRMGRVEDGNTVSDYDAEEIRRRVSISASLIPVEWKDTKINFLDTPGFFDFAGAVHEALSVADATLILANAKSGIEVGTEIAWENASNKNLPKVIFVNGMDDENADYFKVVEDMRSFFGTGVVPLHLPYKNGNKLAGYVDVLTGKAYAYDGINVKPCDMPADMADHYEEHHATLLEAIAETDEALMEKFFGDEALTEEEMQNGLKSGLASGAITPVLCGVATAGLGAVPLLDMLVNVLPPAGVLRQVAQVQDAKGEMIELPCDANGPLCAFVFKTIADPYVGRLSLFRVYSGTIKREVQLFNVTQDAPEKPGHIYLMRGKEQIEATEVRAGDIGAIAKLAQTSTQDTLTTKANPLTVPKFAFPPSLLSMAIAPKGKGDEDKIAGSVSKLLEEDKTLIYKVDKETKQTIVSGIGDSQLDVLINRLKARYKIEAELSLPIVPYREMIKSKVQLRAKHKKQSGGSGQFGDVEMVFEHSGNNEEPYVFEEKIVGGAVPKQYFPAVEKGIQESVKAGPLAAYPVVGLKATLVFGSYHAVDSSEIAFKMATIKCFKEAFMTAKPVLLEPVMKCQITVPDDYTGDIMGDMNKRRGRIMGMEKVGAKQVISAEAPLSEMQKYPTDLRSMTQGRGSFIMEFERYDEAPSDVQQKVITARKQELEALRDKD